MVEAGAYGRGQKPALGETVVQLRHPRHFDLRLILRGVLVLATLGALAGCAGYSGQDGGDGYAPMPGNGYAPGGFGGGGFGGGDGDGDGS